MSNETPGADALAAHFGKGDFAPLARAMSAELAAALSLADLAQLGGELAGAFGAFEEALPATRESQGDVVLAIAPLRFARGLVDLKMAFRGDRLVGLFVAPHEEPAPPWRAPDYADPQSFEEVEIAFADLPGTLTLPIGAVAPPAVLLVHGSGPNDRDESHGPNRPFRDLAWGLASRGVAVLRYEKRTKVRPGDFAALANPTVREEVLDDVALALRFLRARPEIDPGRLVALGHSLGGMLGPRIAADNPGLAGLVLMAAAARPLPDVTIEQFEYLASLRPPDEAGRARLRELRREAERVKAARPGDFGPPFLGAPLSYWADLNLYDPVGTAKTLALPILALQGGRDYQVTETDFRLFEAALRDNPRAICRLIPSLNHVMMTGEGRSAPDEYSRPGHVALEAIEAVAAFALGLKGVERNRA